MSVPRKRLPKLGWKSVEAGGTCAYPDLVEAFVPGGRIIAGTNWDSERDMPGPWGMVFVPDPRPGPGGLDL